MQAMVWSGVLGLTSMGIASSCRDHIDAWPHTLVEQSMRDCSTGGDSVLTKPATATERPTPPMQHKRAVGPDGSGIHSSAVNEDGLAASEGEAPTEAAEKVAGDGSFIGGNTEGQ